MCLLVGGDTERVEHNLHNICCHGSILSELSGDLILIETVLMLKLMDDRISLQHRSALHLSILMVAIWDIAKVYCHYLGYVQI